LAAEASELSLMQASSVLLLLCLFTILLPTERTVLLRALF